MSFSHSRKIAATVRATVLFTALFAAFVAPVMAQQDMTPGDSTPGDSTAPPGTKPAVSPGNGMVAGITRADGSLLFYCKDALLSGFDWFTRLHGWFPNVAHSSYSASPTHQLVNMAYAIDGRMHFNNVQVPSAGTYTMTVRYAFASGLFPGVTDRQMGIAVNGSVVTNAMHFPITKSFNVFRESSLQIPLKAGVNTLTIFAVTSHGVSRVDTVTIKKN